MWHTYGNRKFRSRNRVLTSKAYEHQFNGLEVPLWSLVQRVVPEHYLARLANGPDCDRNSCTSNSLASTVDTYPNLSTKAGDRLENGSERLVLVIRIHSEGLDIPPPSIPKTHPLLSSRYHTSNANGSISSLEVTLVVILGDTTKSCQHASYRSGK